MCNPPLICVLQGYHTGNGNVFAVHGTDAAGVSAILASWEHCGRTGTTNLGCRCTAQDVSGDDWTADEYDDSSSCCILQSVRRLTAANTAG